MKVYRPRLIQQFDFSSSTKLRDAVLIVAAFVACLAMTLIGLVVVAIALPFSYTEGERNAAGWQMRKLPKWAWPWSNDHDGIEGDQSCRYQIRDGYGFGWWPRYNWTALRNSCNNFARFVVGFDFKEVDQIQWVGTHPNTDEKIPGFTYFRARVNGRWWPGIYWNNGRFSWRAGWRIRAERKEDRTQIGFTLTGRPEPPFTWLTFWR